MFLSLNKSSQKIKMLRILQKHCEKRLSFLMLGIDTMPKELKKKNFCSRIILRRVREFLNEKNHNNDFPLRRAERYMINGTCNLSFFFTIRKRRYPPHDIHYTKNKTICQGIK